MVHSVTGETDRHLDSSHTRNTWVIGTRAGDGMKAVNTAHRMGTHLTVVECRIREAVGEEMRAPLRLSLQL
jgi:hypothetical protein